MNSASRRKHAGGKKGAYVCACSATMEKTHSNSCTGHSASEQHTGGKKKKEKRASETTCQAKPVFTINAPVRSASPAAVDPPPPACPTTSRAPFVSSVLLLPLQKTSEVITTPSVLSRFRTLRKPQTELIIIRAVADEEKGEKKSQKRNQARPGVAGGEDIRVSQKLQIQDSVSGALVSFHVRVSSVAKCKKMDE